MGKAVPQMGRRHAMTMVTCEWNFQLTDVGDVQELPTHAEGLMKELLTLEECNEQLTDSAVGLDMETVTIQVAVTAECDTFEQAVAEAMSAIRTAIHANGGTTADWPQDLPTKDDAIEYEPRGMQALV